MSVEVRVEFGAKRGADDAVGYQLCFRSGGEWYCLHAGRCPDTEAERRKVLETAIGCVSRVYYKGVTASV